jgi:ribA/ribD-fused uncharacterized protein
VDIDELRQRELNGESFELLFFGSHRPMPGGKIGTSCLSQLWTSPFDVDGDTYVTAEHYVMVGKARLFGDEAMAAHILKTPSPEEAIALGREVRGFDRATWVAARPRLIIDANRAKFTGRPELGVYLTQHTGQKILVHTGPGNLVWGIGLASNDIRARSPLAWPGTNLLGFALMEVREELRCRT